MSPTLKYPYRWGANVVNAFVEKYPRATYNAANVLGISPGELRFALVKCLCCDHRVRFVSLKKFIQLFNDYDHGELKRFSAPERKLLHKYYLYLAEDEALDALSERKALDIPGSHFLPF